MRYFVQHVAGTGELVEAGLPTLLGSIDVVYRDDSALMFESPATPEAVAGIPFVKNSFVVLLSTPRSTLDGAVQQLSRQLGRSRPMPYLPKARTFRTMVHVDGSLAAVSPSARASLERAVAGRTGGRLEPRGMCQEYWVIGRESLSDLVLSARLPKASSGTKIKGALAPELASMLVIASTPSPGDVFLDPFGGSGSLVLARLGWPARKIIYSDRALAEHQPHFPAPLANSKRVRFLPEDALSLPSVPDGQVDVIVTDPPWGEFDVMDMPYEQFAQAAAQSFERVLSRRGRCVILVNRRNAEVFGRAIERTALELTARHDILVNGHPASALVSARPDRERLTPAG